MSLFYIDSKVHKPNHGLALKYAQEWCERGFRFNREAWSEIVETTNEKKEQLIKYDLKIQKVRSRLSGFEKFQQLRNCRFMYDLKKGGWDLTVDALCEVAEKFTGIPEITTLYEYKQAMAIARSFQTLEALEGWRHRTSEGKDHIHEPYYVRRTVFIGIA